MDYNYTEILIDDELKKSTPDELKKSEEEALEAGAGFSDVYGSDEY